MGERADEMGRCGMLERELEPLIDGLAFGEAPRWHGERLVFSDIADHAVKTLAKDGRLETLVELGGRRPSGLGWLPDGRLLVVSMEDHELLRLDAAGLAKVADISAWCGGHANDMVVDSEGRAYIGNLGCDFEAAKIEFRPTHIVRVDPDGSVWPAASGMMCPNGMAISEDGRTLIAAESPVGRLTAFDIASDGSLSGRRAFAGLPNRVMPDGICLDAEAAVWIASPTTNELLRVHEGGGISERVATARSAIACVLGGEDRRTLFAITCGTRIHEAAAARDGHIGIVRVDVPGAGSP
jgi:sugar lactone lactonase YvrE